MNEIAHVMKKRIMFSRLFIDESDTIKNNINKIGTNEVECYYAYDRNSSTIGFGAFASQFIWYISSSIQNTNCANSSFVSDIYRSISHYWKYVIIKNDNAIVKQSFDLPDINYRTILCRRVNNLTRILNGLISAEIVEMINADSIEAAINTISEQCEETDEMNIISVITHKYKIQIHNKRLELDMVKNRIYPTQSAKDDAINRIESSIKEIENKIELIEQRIKEENSCNICFAEPDNKIILNCCQHLFCADCILVWLNKKEQCPCCRQNVSKKDIVIIKDTDKLKPVCESESAGVEEQADTKLNELFKIVSQPGSRKFLVCSNHFETFDNIIIKLAENNIRYAMLKGTSSHINKIIEEYKNGSLNLIFLNTQYFGSGFNLENTTDIVLYHNMTTDIENQAIGRGQRFGRTTPLNVWKLLYPDENN